MTLMLVLNVLLELGVTAMVVVPLVWAIRTAHRDLPAAGGAAGSAGADRARRTAARVAWTGSPLPRGAR